MLPIGRYTDFFTLSHTISDLNAKFQGPMFRKCCGNSSCDCARHANNEPAHPAGNGTSPYVLYQDGMGKQVQVQGRLSMSYFGVCMES